MPSLDLYREALCIRLIEQHCPSSLRRVGCSAPFTRASGRSRALLPWTIRSDRQYRGACGRDHGPAGLRRSRRQSASLRPGLLQQRHLGTIVPVAAGLAYAQMLSGKGGITLAFDGDGTLGERALYEALNKAAKWRLSSPVVLENNLYVQSTSQTATSPAKLATKPKRSGSRYSGWTRGRRPLLWRPRQRASLLSSRARGPCSCASAASVARPSQGGTKAA